MNNTTEAKKLALEFAEWLREKNLSPSDRGWFGYWQFSNGKSLISANTKKLFNQFLKEKVDGWQLDEHLYEFLFTDCIYESAHAAMSTHRTKEGAYKAMRAYITELYNDWRDESLMYGRSLDKPFTASNWRINKIKLID